MNCKVAAMMVRHGYKVTEAGIIPEEWEAWTLGAVTLGKPMYGANVAAADFDESLPRYVRITDIRDNGKLHNDDLKSYPNSDAADCRLTTGDLCFARSGATVGKTYLYNSDDGDCVFAGYLIKFVPDPLKVTPRHLFYYTHSQPYYDWVAGNLRQGAQPNINAQEYSSMYLPVPPLPEQRKIADILSTVDQYITETESLTKKTKFLKQGMMQRLLTQGIGHIKFKDTEIGRIPVEWAVYRTDDISRQLKPGKLFDKATVSTEGLVPVLSQGEDDYIGFHDEEPGVVASVDHPVVTFANHTCALRLMKRPFSCIQNIFPKIGIEGISDTTYFYYATLGKVLMTAYKGHHPIFRETLVPVPPICEQRQIAAILSTVDAQIDTYHSKLAALTCLKAGLMQQLLTGKIRVKI
jgi:type I restriction enzyme, S subunit